MLLMISEQRGKRGM